VRNRGVREWTDVPLHRPQPPNRRALCSSHGTDRRGVPPNHRSPLLNHRAGGSRRLRTPNHPMVRRRTWSWPRTSTPSAGHHSSTVEYHARTIARLEATIDNYTRALEQAEEDDDGPQTARWSGGGPSRGCGHASRTQEGTPPERKPPPVDDYVRELERMEAEGYGPQTIRWRDGGPGRDPLPANAYARTVARVDDNSDQPRQTARWSGGGPSRRCRHAPRMDTAGRTQPHETARRGGGRFRR
jgi:hypothetical protein